MRLLILICLIQTQILFSQQDSSVFLKRITIESNISIGMLLYSVNYYSPSQTVYGLTEKGLYSETDISLMYRDKCFKSGIVVSGVFLLDYQDNYFCNLNFTSGMNTAFFSKNKKTYFGPFVSFGYIIGDSLITNIFRFSLSFGLDYYYKKFHFALFHNEFIPIRTNISNSKGSYNYSSFGLRVGFMLPIKRMK